MIFKVLVIVIYFTDLGGISNILRIRRYSVMSVYISGKLVINYTANSNSN